MLSQTWLFKIQIHHITWRKATNTIPILDYHCRNLVDWKSTDNWGHKLDTIKRSNKDKIYKELIRANNFDSRCRNLVNWDLLTIELTNWKLSALCIKRSKYVKLNLWICEFVTNSDNWGRRNQWHVTISLELAINDLTLTCDSV